MRVLIEQQSYLVELFVGFGQQRTLVVLKEQLRDDELLVRFVALHGEIHVVAVLLVVFDLLFIAEHKNVSVFEEITFRIDPHRVFGTVVEVRKLVYSGCAQRYGLMYSPAGDEAHGRAFEREECQDVENLARNHGRVSLKFEIEIDPAFLAYSREEFIGTCKGFFVGSVSRHVCHQSVGDRRFHRNHEISVHVGNDLVGGFLALQNFDGHVGYRQTGFAIPDVARNLQVTRKAFEVIDVVAGSVVARADEHAFPSVHPHGEIIVVGGRVEWRAEIDGRIETPFGDSGHEKVHSAHSDSSVGSEEEISVGDVGIDLVSFGVYFVEINRRPVPRITVAVDVPYIAFAFASRHGRSEIESVAVGREERMPYGFTLGVDFDLVLLLPFVLFHLHRVDEDFRLFLTSEIRQSRIGVVEHYAVVGEVLHFVDLVYLHRSVVRVARSDRKHHRSRVEPSVEGFLFRLLVRDGSVAKFVRGYLIRFLLFGIQGAGRRKKQGIVKIAYAKIVLSRIDFR